MRRTLLLLSLALLSVSPAFPEENTVTVTATRVEVPVDAVGDDVEVITKEEIEEKGFTSIADVLREIAGVHISNLGGPGKQTSVFLQGLDPKYILVLVDGIPVNDPSSPSNAANFEWLDLSNVERIEVLKGSQSSLYGSEAIGGVINIITKEPRKNYLRANFETGKYSTFKENLSGATVTKNGYVGFSVENFKTLGFSATNEKSGSWTYNPDHDPFHYTTGQVFFGYRPSERFKLKGTTLVKEGYVNYDSGNNPARTNYSRLFNSLSAELAATESLLLEFKLGNNRERREDINSYPYFEGVTRYVSASSTYFLYGNSFLKGGASYRYEIARSNSYPSVDNKRTYIKSVFLEGHTEIAGTALTAVVREDKHQTFGSRTTYKFSAAHRIRATGTVLKAQYGTGFKAPTVTQLYGYYSSSWGTLKGNPDLDPEKSEGWTLGLSQELLGKGSFSVNYFKNRIWNVINTVFKGTYQTYENADRVVTEGAELKLNISLTENLSLFGSYTHLRAKEKKNGNWKELERRPKESYTAGLRLKTGKFSFTTWFDHYGRRKDTDWSTGTTRKVTIDGFTTFNCYASYKLNNRVKLYAKGVNLTDKKYELAYGYNTMGRALFLGATVSFK